MTSSDPQQPGDGTYDPTVIRPVEPTPGPDLTKRDSASDVGGDPDAATTVHPTAQPDPYAAPSNPYAPPADPYAAPNPYANPYGGAPADPYAGPPAYPGPQQYGQQQYGQQPLGQQPGFPAYPGQNAPGYPAPGYGAQPTGTNGLAIAAMICGIISIPANCFYGGIVFGLVGVIMGVIAMKQTKQSGQDGHGMALAGVITGAIGILIFVVVVIIVIVAVVASPSSSRYLLDLAGALA